ncbi:hypothetical protein QE364_003219 [Nocardioides zeae]|uniref:Uncharacterized protein n=1 Tax=Nocardioides zeae TaxID=1457234 RepID=A0ACC6ILG0_9ACTN|nr:hypothetical protein [Nocardioides zeae]MDR6173949.1 hypothetical protein [Nocardioides zeae]MDR6211495.1 hypothetical protein [Nocardioides zeae]
MSPRAGLALNLAFAAAAVLCAVNGWWVPLLVLLVVQYGVWFLRVRSRGSRAGAAPTSPRREPFLWPRSPQDLAEQIFVELVADHDPDGDPDHPLHIEFDDEVAHDHEALVAALAEDVAHAPGVAYADHLDREVIGVQGALTAPQLRRWVDDWIATNVRCGVVPEG